MLSSLVNVATPEEQKSILLLLPPKLVMSVNVLLPQLVNVAFLFDTKRYVQCCVYSERLIYKIIAYFDTVPPLGYSIEDLRSRKAYFVAICMCCLPMLVDNAVFLISIAATDNAACISGTLDCA